ncbi:MAG: hypothetical protein OXR66_01685 [Candidatus Woesearchaeota archaeon]|nr:hypothetical protein [Candidatus Woesearchaeota archaeon]
MASLVEYIIKEERAGYTEAQIRQVLSQQYNKAEIDNAFASLQHTGSANTEIQYVQEYARQGYTPEQIFSTLIGQDHKPGAVKKAINSVFGSGTIHTKSNLSTVVFVLIALFIGAGGMFFLLDKPTGIQPGTAQAVNTFSPSATIAGVLETTQREGALAGIGACQEQLAGVDRDKCVAAVAVAAQDHMICGQIVDLSVHDSCLLNLIGTDFAACENVKLAESRATCDSVRALQGAAAWVV